MSKLTAEQYKESFQKELKELLSKYKVEITLEDFGRDYLHDYMIVAEFDYHEDFGQIKSIEYGTNIFYD